MAIPTAQGGWTTSPKQAAGESDAAYQARLRAWMAGGVGVTLGGAGIPKPVYRAAGDLVSPSGAVLGAFPVANADALPAPTRMGPFGRSEAGLIELDDPGFGQGRFLPMPVAPPRRGPGLRRGGPSNGPVFRGPIGAPPPSLREPTDPTPYDLECETARLATGYDPSWGTPPDRLGLAWDPVRFLYEPMNDRDGLPYAFAARDARYLQAVQRPDGTWSERWVLALAPRPDRERPYRGLDRTESSRLDAEVARMRRAESSYDARWKRGEVTRYEHPAIEFTPRYGPAKPAPKLSDFAWIGWRQLPVGCPYPYPAMPVPIADYTSGRWLAEDYVPSIPLPSPYDQVAWRCGVPRAPGTEHKGPAYGNQALYDKWTKNSQTSSSGAVADESPLSTDLSEFEASVAPGGADESDDLPGIPEPTGSAIENPDPTPFPSQSDARAELDRTVAKEAALRESLKRAVDSGDAASARKIAQEIDRVRADGRKLAEQVHDEVASKKIFGGSDGYASASKLGESRPPPGVLADPGSSTNAGGWVGGPSAPPPLRRKPFDSDQARELDQRLIEWQLAFRATEWFKGKLSDAASLLRNAEKSRDDEIKSWNSRNLKVLFDSNQLSDVQKDQYLVELTRHQARLRELNSSVSMAAKIVESVQEGLSAREDWVAKTLAAIRKEAPASGGTGVGFESLTDKMTPPEIEAGIENSEVRISADRSAGVLFNPKTGWGVVVVGMKNDAGSGVDTYDYKGGQNLIFGAQDYQSRDGEFSLMVMRGSGDGGTTVHEWFLFKGDVDRNFAKHSSQTAWGDSNPRTKLKNYPVARSKRRFGG